MKTLQVQERLGLGKTVKFRGELYSSLTIPRFPSSAYDRMVARGGLNVAAAGTPLKRTSDNVIVGITRKCLYNCEHCYERHNIAAGDTVPVERWKEVVRSIQTIGANIIIFSGGEPMLRYDAVLELLSHGDKGQSDFHLHTSGSGMTQERARELKQSGLVAAGVGLDDVDPGRYDRLRGHPGGFREAVDALKWLNEAGILTYVNICATKELVHSGDLWRYYRLVKDVNVSLVQLLEPRPHGGYRTRAMSDLFTDVERRILTEFYLTGNHSAEYRDYPLLYYVAYLEAPERMGCMMGGLSHYSIDSAGNVIPCVFLPVSFGNILTEDLEDIFRRMRNAIPHPLRKQCPSILLADTLKSEMSHSGPAPVPFRAIERQWEGMFAERSSGEPDSMMAAG